MPCEHCGYYDHKENECPVARYEQRRKATLGRVMLVVLSPLFVVGAIIGVIYGGLRAGFRGTRNLWDQALVLVRRKPDPPETA